MAFRALGEDGDQCERDLGGKRGVRLGSSHDLRFNRKWGAGAVVVFRCRSVAADATVMQLDGWDGGDRGRKKERYG